MGKFEDLLEQLSEYDVPEDIVDGLSEFKGSSLRKRAESATELERERDELKAKLAAIEVGKSRTEAFRSYGIDLENLRAAEREALERAEIPEAGINDQWIAGLAEKYQLPMLEVEQTEPAAKPAAAQIVDQARNTQGRVANTVLKPEEVTQWPAEKLRRLFDKHPEEYEALLRGETVTGLAFQ